MNALRQLPWQFRSAAVVCFLAIGVLGQTQIPQLVIDSYRGDAAFLTSFSLFINNFPPSFWVPDINPCPTGDWIGVTCNPQGYVTEVDLSYAKLPTGSQPLAGSLDWNITGVLYLTTLNLAGNNFSGAVPPELSLSRSLKTLNLEDNKFSGNISNSLGLLNLTCLHLSGNNFSGVIPPSLKTFPCADFAGNPLLKFISGVDCVDTNNTKSCAANTTVSVAPPAPASSGDNVGAIVGGVVGGLAFIALLLAAFLFYRRYQERKRKEEEDRKLAEDIENQISTRHFGTLRRLSVPELSASTNNFDEDNLLGEGGFAKVYKGKLEDGKVVAIKRIKEERRAGGELQFLNEVELISRAVHRNLMRCEGFCVEQGECMLVLPFMSNGSVASRTQGKEGNPMDWPTRQRVAQGAAEGVAYLHTDCNPKLIHRDIKADNVLLDENDEAVIADFGLAKEMDVKETHATTAVKGTIGHIAPEYFVSGQMSEKTDVYAFGVFLLELVSGKSVFELTVAPEAEDMLLRDWVARLMKDGKIPEFVDTELSPSDYSVQEVGKMLQVALLCIQNDPNDRPGMDEVAKMLAGKGLAEKWEQWQEEAGNMKADDLMQVVNTPSIWENTTTGISLDAFQLTGPR